MATDRQKMGDIKKMRYSDKEMSLIKSTFAENDPLLISIRKHFIQAELTKDDKANLAVLKGEALDLLKKTILPEIEPDAPLGQAIDLFLTVEIKEKGPEEAWPHILAREKVIAYLSQRFDELEGKKVAKQIDFRALTKVTTSEETFVNLVARNTVIQHVDFQLIQTRILAGMKEETVEQTVARLAKNSAK